MERVAGFGEMPREPARWEDSIIADAALGRCRLQSPDQGGAWVLAVPLRAAEETVGVLVLARGASTAFTAAEQALARTAADLIAAVMRSERLHALETRAAAEDERRRIARDLHDAVTQSIYSANLLAEGLPATWAHSPERAMDDVLLIRRLIRAAFAELRILLFELRPETLEMAPLDTLLQRLVDAFAGQVETDVALAVDPDVVLAPDVRTVFYRVAQEALNNVAKHAKAAHASVELTREGAAARLVVHDDGRGFDPATAPLGIGRSSMRERAAAIGARLTVESEPWAGTTVTLMWRPPEAAADAAGAVAAPQAAAG